MYDWSLHDHIACLLTCISPEMGNQAVKQYTSNKQIRTDRTKTECKPAGLQVSTVAISSLGGRVPQIWMNYQRGNSGELSIATCVLNLAGNLARVFTTLVVTKVGCATSTVTLHLLMA